MPHTRLTHYPLDNAAHLFAMIRSKRFPAVFRLSLVLRDPVDPQTLQEALLLIIDQFPYYRVRLKKGLFWHCFEHNPREPRILPDSGRYCAYFSAHDHGYLFRVIHHHHRISIEFCHVLTDGAGGMKFLIALAAAYLRLKGITGLNEPALLPGAKPDPEEAEDAYKRYYHKTIPPKRYSRAYHPGGKLLPPDTYIVTTGVVPLSSILQSAKNRQVSLTEFMAAVYLEALQKMCLSDNGSVLSQPLRLSVPVNARRLFPTRTLRNFSLFAFIGLEPRDGGYSFEEILQAVHQSMRAEVNPLTLQRQIYRHVRSEYNPIVRAIPLFLKQIIMAAVYRRSGESPISGGFSNLGPVDLPPEMDPYVTDAGYIPSATLVNRHRCGVISLRDKLYITMGRVCAEPVLERLFFSALAELGLPIEMVDDMKTPDQTGWSPGFARSNRGSARPKIET